MSMPGTCRCSITSRCSCISLLLMPATCPAHHTRVDLITLRLVRITHQGPSLCTVSSIFSYFLLLILKYFPEHTSRTPSALVPLFRCGRSSCTPAENNRTPLVHCRPCPIWFLVFCWFFCYCFPTTWSAETRDISSSKSYVSSISYIFSKNPPPPMLSVTFPNIDVLGLKGC